MNYDRLLQLGGIDREVPPVPGYITKEQLQGEIDDVSEWQQEQEAVIPDNVIKGIKEIENFLANTSDATTLVAMLENLVSNYYTKGQTNEAITQNVAQVLDTFEVDEESGDITIEYDDGQTEVQ